MLRYLIGGLLAAGLVAILFVVGAALLSPPEGDPRNLARGSVSAFEFLDPKPAPDTPFLDGEGREVRLADFRGKVLLVNLWATWCAPCKTEMPTLDALQAEMGGEDFQVVAISMDHQGPDLPQGYLERAKLVNIALYTDRTGRMVGKLAARGLPFTFLVDRRSRVVGRLIGPAEWDSPEAKALLRHFIEG